MKVLFAVKTLANAVGGAERLAACLSTSISEANKGWTVSILTFDNADEKPFYQIGNKIACHHLGIKDTSQKIQLREYPSLLLRIRQQVLKEKPDIIIAFMHSMFVPLSLALIGSGIKIILSEHTVPKYYETRKFEFILLYLCSFLSNGITVPSKHIGELYPKRMQKRMTFLQNPVISSFKKADVINNKIVLSVGRLNQDKDYQILIKAFSIIAHKNSEWTLVIYGDGIEKRNLEILVSQYDMNDRVILAGVESNIDAVYQKAGIFVLPSKYESFGLSVGEAMSHGLPTIGFQDCTGISELIKNNLNGILVMNRDPQSLSEAIEYLIQYPSVRKEYGDIGYQISQQFKLKNCTEVWSEYIQGLACLSE